MVSDMKNWCNQQKYPQCLTCKDKGWFIKMDVLVGQVGKVCYCEAGVRFSNESQYSPKPRMGWDKIWMNLAKDVATMSTCKVPHRQVGCVIVSDDNTAVLAIGYNGGAKGDDNNCDYDGDKKIGDSRCTCVHSEMNSLVKLDTPNPCKKKMYLTLSPCKLCYKLIVNAGINEVIYLNEYDADINKKLQQLGVRIKKYENS